MIIFGASMPNCFIAMPITTHDPSLYSDDSDHFSHVLEHLFVPAVELAGFTAVRPIAEGADVIHAEIIRKIESADLVLCDMSSLNPNVFFELGIRTALNKPISLVKDDVTPRVPFDTGIINNHTYLSALAPWHLEVEIRALSEHIKKSAERGNGNNAMWQYFSLTSRGNLQSAAPNADAAAVQLLNVAELQYRGLSEEISRLMHMLDQRLPDKTSPLSVRTRNVDPGEPLFNRLVAIASKAGVTVINGKWTTDNVMTLTLKAPEPHQAVMSSLILEAVAANFKLTIVISS